MQNQNIVESTQVALEADKARTALAQSTEVEHESASSESEESDLHDENTEESDISENENEDEAESAESENDEGLKDETKEDKQKKPSKLAKRFGKLTARATKAEQEAEFWKAEALKNRTSEKQEPQKAQDINPKKSEEPNPDDYETNAEFIRAYTKWEIANEKAAIARENQEAKLKADYQAREKAFGAKVDEYKSKNPSYEQDLNDFLEDHGDIAFSPALNDCILSSDLGPAVIHELLKNPENFLRINSLGANQAMREFGKIEARIESSLEKSKNPSPKLTKAPPPISAVGKGTATVQKALSDPTISFAEYEAQRIKQLKAKK